MNNKHNLAKTFGKPVPKFAPTFGKTSINLNFLTLMLTALLITSATGKAHAVCQTPQFALPVVLTVNRPVAVAPGDFNRDGYVDLAVLRNLQSGTFPGVVEVFLNNGNGNFTSTGVQYNALPVGGQILIYDLAAADFNRDGRLDLVAVGTGSGIASILLGNGNGGFGSPTEFSTAGNATSVAIADFNNDTFLDLVTRGFSGASVLPG